MKTTTDLIKQAQVVRQRLQSRKTELERELSEINRALNGHASAAGPRMRPVSRPVRQPIKLVKNQFSLRDMVLRATAKRPLTKSEILDAVQKAGYKFATNDPANSLNALLYSKDGPCKRQGEKWSPK